MRAVCAGNACDVQNGWNFQKNAQFATSCGRQNRSSWKYLIRFSWQAFQRPSCISRRLELRRYRADVYFGIFAEARAFRVKVNLFAFQEDTVVRFFDESCETKASVTRHSTLASWIEICLASLPQVMITCLFKKIQTSWRLSTFGTPCCRLFRVGWLLLMRYCSSGRDDW